MLVNQLEYPGVFILSGKQLFSEYGYVDNTGNFVHPSNNTALMSRFLNVDPNVVSYVVLQYYVFSACCTCAFFDEDYSLISLCPTDDLQYMKDRPLSTQYLYVPRNARYLVVSTYRSNYSNPYTISKCMLSVVNTCGCNVSKVSGITKLNQYIDNNGSIKTVQNNLAWRTSYMLIDAAIKSVKIHGLHCLKVESALSFFDENRIFISGVLGKSEYGDNRLSDYESNVPENTKYIIISGFGGETYYQTELELYFHYLEDSDKTLTPVVPDFIHHVSYISFGDSITSGAGSIGHNNSYASRLNNYLKFQQFQNYGVSGSCVVCPSIVRGVLYQQTSKVSQFRGIITIAIGTNDYGADNILGDALAISTSSFDSLTAPKNTYDSSYTFCEGFRYTLESLKRNNPKAIVCILLPINRNNENNKNSAGNTLEDFRNAERIIAESLGCIVVDMKQCGLPMITNTTYTSDGLHPNEFGYEIMSSYLVPKMIDWSRSVLFLESRLD